MSAPQSSAFLFSRANRRLWLWLAKTYVRPYRWRLVGAAVAMAVTAGTTAAMAWLLKPVIDGFVANANASDFWQTPLLLLVVLIANGIALYFQATLVQEVGQKIVARLQVELFDHFTGADLSYRFDHHTGNLINRCVHDTGLVQNAVSGALLSILRDSLMFLLLVGVVVARDWVLAVSTILILPLLGLGIAFLSKRARRLTQDSMTRAGELTTAIHEAFEGVRLVKVYGAEKTESARVAKAVEERRKASSALTRVRALTSPLSEILCGFSLVAALYYGWGEATAGRLTLGDLGSFLAALLLAYRPLKRLASFNVTLQEGLVAAERIRETLVFKPKVVERPGAPALQVKGGEVRFEGVHFSYGDGEEVLRGIDLVAPAGKTVALVGVSGAGKSTILNLIPRLYDVSAGRITIDGVDIRDVSLSSLRQAMAMVTQETLLFDETVRANIAYSKPEASEAEIEAAARAAAAHDFIQALPEGYATRVKQHGQRLSGGQRQRLAIARAMLRKAPILLLDEATSALDNEAEQQVKTALQRLMQGRTTLLVAHRLSTVIDASIIYVLSAGQVIECGDHASLIRQAGAYARLYAADAENALA